MVATVGSISIDLSTNVAKFASGFRSAATTVDRESTRMSRSIQSADRAAASFVRNSVAGLAAGLGVREVTRYADAWTEAGNQIAAAGKIAGVQTRSLGKLNDIATDTRSGLQETVGLYSRLIQATSNLAVSEERVAKVTEIVNKAFKAGGKSAQEQAAGILQLGQALGSGRLAGDELRSVAENAGILAQVIADEFGVTIGQLKDLGAEGALTADRVFQAIEKGEKKIQAAFAATQATLSDNLTLLRNASIELIGTLDSTTGATTALSGGMSSLAKEIRAAAEASKEFASSGELDDFLRIFGLSFEEGGVADRIRDFYNEWRTQSVTTADQVRADIADIEQKIVDLILIGDDISLGNAEKLQEDADFLKQKLAELEAAAASTAQAIRGSLAQSFRESEIASMEALNQYYREKFPSPTGRVADQKSGVGVTRYGQETADNTEATSDHLADLNARLPRYFDDLARDVGSSFDNSWQSINSLLERGFGIAYDTIADGVRTGIISGLQQNSQQRQQYTISNNSVASLNSLFESMGSSYRLNSGGYTYAGAFAEGGSFIAPGNQTGDTSRLIMDVNGGERVTVSPSGSDRPIILNYSAAPGETERTARQNARFMAQVLQRETSRA